MVGQWANRVILAAVLIGLSPLHEAHSQTSKVWRMGLWHVGLDHEPPSLDPLKEELAHLGYVDGRNLVFDWSNQATEETASTQIRDWLAKNYDLIVAFEDQCVRAAKAATSSIPIVFAHSRIRSKRVLSRASVNPAATSLARSQTLS